MKTSASTLFPCCAGKRAGAEDFLGRLFLWSCLIKVRGLLRQRSYNALYTRHLKSASFFLKFKEHLRLPILFEAHEIFFLTTDRKDKVDKIKGEEFRIYPRLDGIISITRGLAGKMQEVFGLRMPMAVAPDGST